MLLCAILFGVIVGSFLNALSFRFNTGRSIIWDGPSTKLRASRSRCMQCGHTLSSLDLVPVLSYLFLGGRCRYCSSQVSLQYPLIEVVAGALAGGIYHLYPVVTDTGLHPLSFVYWFVAWMTLLFVVIYDTKHKIIPWSCSLLLIVLAVFGLLLGLIPRAPDTWALLAGPLLALPLFLLSLVSWGRWMGWADSVLELSLGWLLGVSAGATALMLAFWSGAIIGIMLIFFSRIFPRQHFFGYTIKSEVPFAPFLILGAMLAYFFHVDFFSTLIF